MVAKQIVDESELTKMQVRKLNALRKSVGDDIGENAFLEWLRTQDFSEPDADPNIELIALVCITGPLPETFNFL